MIEKTRILYAITYQSHTELGLDEINGLQQLGYKCDHFDYGGKKEFKSLFKRFYLLMLNAFKLIKKIHQFKPTCIYFNSRVEYRASTRDFITILLIKLFFHKKQYFFIKSHGSDLEVLKSQSFFYSKIVFAFLRKYVTAWLFLSNEEINWIKSHDLIEKNRLFLTKNIVRPEKFKVDSNFRKNFRIPEDCKILLFAGRLIERKGVHYVVKAFAEIKKAHNCILIIIGDGEELPNVQNMVQTLGIENNVILTGWIDEKKVAYYTSNSDLLVFPTFFPEGFPMVLFNSLAAGLSIVTTPIRAAKDYLTEPENCLWVESKSSTSIKNAVTQLLDNPDLMEKMRINNKARSHLFTRDVVSKELSLIFDSCCK